MNNTIINKAADNIRILSAAMVEKAKSGHPGGAMGAADFINILYAEFLNFDPADLSWANRDRFFLDPGHMSPMLYATLAMYDIFSTDELKSFRQWGSSTPGHPELNRTKGIENTSGPLGQGHAAAVGAAIAERFLVARFGEWMSHKTYTFISDGGIQEEISQSVGRIAGHLGLNNLIMFYDSNKIQLSTNTYAVSSENTAKKYEAWGWKVMTINANNADEIRKALRLAKQEKEKPFLIIGQTIMGKACVDDKGNSFEGQCATHGMPISKAGASFEKTLQNLGGNPDEPFAVFPEVKEYFKNIIEQKTAQAAEKKAMQKNWEKENPELAAQLEKFYALDIAHLDFEAIEQKENIASRAASGKVLEYLAKHLDNIIVTSADLANSDKTDGFLKGGAKPFVKGDFSGNFLHAGVSELGMAAICNGIALHGGIFPACGTFFVFSDYMKPAVRLSALMELPVIYIWSHDAFRVGEDGPTHQPIEQEAQIRLMEKLKNHSGKNSMLVLRPADANETTVAWKMALENKTRPTGLILSRQNIKNLPAENQTAYKNALQAEKGAYVVKKTAEKPDIILLASGSEVSTLLDGAEILNKKGFSTSVVSIISEALFKNQPESYQNKVLPDDIPVFALTAGLPTVFDSLLGKNSRVFGLESFGYSAPANVLDEKLGYTGENVAKLAEEFLHKH